MDRRLRWTFALMVGAAAVVCFVLSGVLDGAAADVFFALGVAFVGSEALPPRLGKRRELARDPLIAGDFSVVLLERGDRPISVIKTLRTVADLDLKSAQQCVQTTPSVVVREVTLNDATAVSEALTRSGARARVERA